MARKRRIAPRRSLVKWGSMVGGGIAIVVVLTAVVIIARTSADPAAKKDADSGGVQTSLERRVVKYFENSRRPPLGRLGAITSVRCIDLNTYGHGTAGCDIVFRKAGRQRWYVIYDASAILIKRCPYFKAAPRADSQGACSVAVPT